jgi:hypothetical protein
MRYLGLILMATASAWGLVMLREALSEAGERFYSTLGFAAIIFAGPLYVVWYAFAFNRYSTQEGVDIPQAMASLRPFGDLLLSVAAALTYFATTAYVVSLSRIGWLGRKASLAYISVTVIALNLILIKIAVHPDPTGDTPWYTIPGFIVTIPALPLITPALLGAVLLRRAGEHGEKRTALPDMTVDTPIPDS